jgi:hypothetical protein
LLPSSFCYGRQLRQIERNRADIADEPPEVQTAVADYLVYTVFSTPIGFLLATLDQLRSASSSILAVVGFALGYRR